MTYSSTLSVHYLELADVPISVGNFAGEDVRYSEEYEKLESEIGKTHSMHGAGVTDWKLVCEIAEHVLRYQSKDLRVAAWLTWGLYEQHHLVGLHAGLAVLAALIKEHWNTLHPSRPRTRLAALTWLVARLESFGDAQHFQSQLRPLIEAIANELQVLDTLLSATLSDEAPSLKPICRRMLEGIQPAEPASETEVAQPASRATPPTAVLPVSTAPTAVATDKDAHKALRAMQEQGRTLCAYWLKQRASDSRPLQLSRLLTWLSVDGLPDHNAEQITSLRSLPADKIRSYRERFEQGLFAELLMELETSLTRAPFWLDGHYLAWQCLEALGATAAMHDLEIQLASFIQRIAGLETLRFHDGTAFASLETRQWLDSQVTRYGAHIPEASTTSATNPLPHDPLLAPAWEATLAEAQAELRKEGLKSGVRRLKLGLTKASGGREQFHWKLALARLCMSAKKYDLARHQLETLDRWLHSNGIAEWEPQLSLQLIQLLHNCLEAMPQNPAIKEARDATYRRLCHLDLEGVLD